MKYFPQNMDSENLLRCIGFVDHPSRGFILTRKTGLEGVQKGKNVHQLHALIKFPDNEIEIHQDFILDPTNKKHISEKKSPRLTALHQLLKLWDIDEINEEGKKSIIGFYRKYGAKLPERYKIRENIK